MATRNQIDLPLFGNTGTNEFVGSSNPSITTPTIDAIYDANNNIILNLFSNANAVNNFDWVNSSTNNAVVINVVGSDTNIRGSLSSKGTSRCQVKGRTNGVSPSSGYVGEFISSVLPAGSAISLTSNVVSSITSISLTAGNWEIWANLAFVLSSLTSVSELRGGFSDTNLTIPVTSTTANGTITRIAPFVPGAVTFAFPVNIGNLNLASSTTWYLSARATFTLSTISAYGMLCARRSN